MKAFDAAATAAALPFARLIPALRERFVAGCEVPPRQVHRVPGPDGAEMTVLIMPAWVPGQVLGVKTVNVAPANAARGLPGLHATYQLYDAASGVPLAMVDGAVLTTRRTIAASALAASFLARDDASHLLVVGAGAVAALAPEAFRQVRPLQRVTLWARDAARARALVARWRADPACAGLALDASDDLAAAAAAADIVSCATLATEPLVQGAWLRAGSHLDLIGSFTPAMREADDACFAGARLFVDTDEALAKSGDLLGPLAHGVIAPADRLATLAELCRGSHPGRRGRDERTVFKSVGTALEDLAAAMLVAGVPAGGGLRSSI